MKIIQARKPYRHMIGNIVYKIGDVLFGKDYLENIDMEELEKKKYVYNTSIRLQCRDIQEDLKRYFQYQCPFIPGNRYFWFNPSFIFTNVPNENNLMHRLMDDEDGGWRSSMLKKIKNDIDRYDECDVFGGEDIYMGHGYTEYTLPDDGSNEKDTVMVRIDTGDILVGKTWVWFNKILRGSN